MNHEEYLQKVKELESEFENKKIELMKDFVRAKLCVFIKFNDPSTTKCYE